MKNKVCILTSVHPPFDVRIFHKEAKSLVKAGYDVTLIAQHDKHEEIDGVKIINLQKPRNRIARMTKTVWSAYRKAVQLDADIYHFHDPELIPVGLLLKKRGKSVIYDVHEDYFESIKLKEWLPSFVRYFIADVFKRFEIRASRKFNVVITATEMIGKRFSREKCNAVWISNYPKEEELIPPDGDRGVTTAKVCFVGGISVVRAIREMTLAAYHANVPLILAGRFDLKSLYREMKAKQEWSIVEERGFVDRAGISKIFAQSIAGLIVYHSHPTAPYSQPNKLFEYMAAGLPVIASNYPLWKEIIVDNNCGICVDPLNIQEIADAINYIRSHPMEAQEMGFNGRKAVLNKYNWTNEEKKLFQVYKDIK